MIRRVRRLPNEVAERIAAGEVVDRPLSIVKELVENSLDAEASRIEVELVDGGKELLRVTDDGVGMSREDAMLCVERHATSKLTAWEDLESLSSFGFRGEALPSIAAVSRFELLTTARGEAVGTRVTMEGPGEARSETAASPGGTRIDVRDLFWNTPARRKFLKASAGEGVQIADLMGRFAVLHPLVGFRLVINGKEKLFFTPDSTQAQRLAQLWKLSESDLLPLDGEQAGIAVCGLVGKPSLHRRNRAAQLLAVNGRIIRSASLSQAFVEGFDPLVPRGRHPYVFAHLTIDPSLVDVNIHPTKAEVRFADQRAPFRAIVGAIRQGLESEKAETIREGAWESVLDQGLSDLFEESASKPPSPLVTNRSFAAGHVPRLPRPNATPTSLSTDRVLEMYRPLTSLESSPSAPSDNVAVQGTLDADSAAPLASRPQLKYLTSLYRSYVVMEVDGQLWVVDQHAAHERIQYERLHRFQICGPDSQGLVVPLEVSLSPAEAVLLETHSARFAEVGFEVEMTAEQSLLLRAVPPGIPIPKVAAFFQELLTELVEDQGSDPEAPVAAYREKLRAMMACKSSIRAREAMSPAEALRLVDDLIEAERSPYCPHGRPTRIRLDLAALERLFHRS